MAAPFVGLRNSLGLLAVILALVVGPACLAAGPPDDGHPHEYKPNPVREIQDTHHWEFFEHFFLDKGPIAWPMPKLFSIPYGTDPTTGATLWYDVYLTKFMVLELIAALLIILIYVPLARSIKDGALPRGRFWNFFEVLLVFIRDNVARPSIGGGHGHPSHEPALEHAHGTKHVEHDAPTHGHGEPVPEPLLGGHPADAYVPFLWTMFLFILFCNLLGMIPMMGSPTASIWVTGGLAIISFAAINVFVIQKHGWGGYARSLWPQLEMPPGAFFKVMGFLITLLLAVIEAFGLIIKSFVLAVRLFANMFAGHMVLANLLLFIYIVGKTFGLHPMWYGVTAASVLGVVALSLLELFVAFLQAYIFTFLTALFIGMQMAHAEHH